MQATPISIRVYNYIDINNPRIYQYNHRYPLDNLMNILIELCMGALFVCVQYFNNELVDIV